MCVRLLDGFLVLNVHNEREDGMNIYVGNLSYSVTDDDLKSIFGEFGEVTRASVIIDKDTRKSKGFGFVEMSDSSEARAAIESLNGTMQRGREIKVNEAQPKGERPQRERHG